MVLGRAMDTRGCVVSAEIRDRQAVFEAIAASWASATAEVPDDWTEDNPAKGHCDVSSFVAWEHLGGCLVLAEVLIDGERSEFHYWNRFDDGDVDLTASQFTGSEEIRELSVLTGTEISERRHTMRPDLARRIELFAAQVRQQL